MERSCPLRERGSPRPLWQTLQANIDLTHGPRLPALPCVLMWATEYEVGALNWKTRALVRAAAGRPFVRVDDSITDPTPPTPVSGAVGASPVYGEGSLCPAQPAWPSSTHVPPRMMTLPRSSGSPRQACTRTVAEVAEVHIHTARPSHTNHSGT